jgi:ketosteroid isomerase-like protein
MSNANITFIQSMYTAFSKGDIATIIANVTPDVDWRVNGSRQDFPTMGDWRGAAEVQKFFAAISQHQESREFTPKEFFAADDHVFVIGHYDWKIRKTGRTAASDWVHIFTIRDGKVVKFREFNDTAKFAEAYRD